MNIVIQYWHAGTCVNILVLHNVVQMKLNDDDTARMPAHTHVAYTRMSCLQLYIYYYSTGYI